MPEKDQPIKKQLNIWLPLLFSLVLVVGMIMGARLNETMGPKPKKNTHHILPNKEPGTLEELVRFIDARYVDNVDIRELSESAIHHILDQLDPHSAFISSDKVASVREQLNGSFVGVGIEFLVIEDTICVVKPSKGGPAEIAGILAGDKIISINDSIVAGTENEVSEMLPMFRGERGTTAKIEVIRDGSDSLLSYEVVRNEIKLPSMDVAYKIENDVAFLKLSRFSSETSAEFIQALERLVEKEGVKDLIIDLRDNPGGYLTEAVEILSQLFSDRDKLLVFTEGEKSTRLEYKTTGKPFYQIEDVVVLVNENSASASEIIAGAIQDWDRGHIIGRRTFGKGLVQEEYSLKDGSALRLTIARYYTPSGRSIQKDYAHGEDNYDREYADRWNSGELFVLDSIHQVDSLMYETPSGRIVYGGGGITPDYFIPLDSLILNDNYTSLRPYVQDFTYAYFRKNKGKLEFENAESFLSDFMISDVIVSDFVDFCKDKGANKVISLGVISSDYFKNAIKAQLGFLMYDVDVQYKVINRSDFFVQKALQLLRDETPIAKKEED